MAFSPSSLIIDGDSSQLITNGSGTYWLTNVGNLYTDAGLTVPYDGVTYTTSLYFKPYNRSITGTIQTGGQTLNVTVNAVVPSYPSYPLEWEGDKIGVVANVSRSGRVTGRIQGDSEYMRNYKIIYNGRKQSEMLDLEDFHAYHYPDRVFKYKNKWYDIEGYFRFDAPLKASAKSRQNGTIEFAIAQVPYP